MSARPSSPSKSTRSEFRLIEELRRRFGQMGQGVVRGIGDDAAILLTSAPDDLLLTTDLLAEGIHFRLQTATLEDIGYKAAMANLSDIAAMGGIPENILVAMAIPQSFTTQAVMKLYQGLMEACRPVGVRMIGGDTSASADGLFLSITMTGRVRHGRALTRGGARIGDLIYVTGTLGDSLAGLQLLSATRARGRLSRSARAFLVSRHRRPTARIKTGNLLARHAIATAAIDVSDGLSGDLAHICEQSAVGAEIDAASLPLSPACRAFATAHSANGTDLALQGGEDYELLFTVPQATKTRVDRLGRQADCRWTCIGVIKPRSFGLRLRTQGGALRRLPITSYQHFQTRRGQTRGVPCFL